MRPRCTRSASRIEQDNAPILAVAGESGSGKTTLARCCSASSRPAKGEIRFRGDDLAKLPARERRRVFRREVQAVFQDPFAVYNPFYRVDHALTDRCACSASRARAARRAR